MTYEKTLAVVAQIDKDVRQAINNLPTEVKDSLSFSSYEKLQKAIATSVRDAIFTIDSEFS